MKTGHWSPGTCISLLLNVALILLSGHTRLSVIPKSSKPAKYTTPQLPLQLRTSNSTSPRNGSDPPLLMVYLHFIQYRSRATFKYFILFAIPLWQFKDMWRLVCYLCLQRISTAIILNMNIQLEGAWAGAAWVQIRVLQVGVALWGVGWGKNLSLRHCSSTINYLPHLLLVLVLVIFFFLLRPFSAHTFIPHLTILNVFQTLNHCIQHTCLLHHLPPALSYYTNSLLAISTLTIRARLSLQANVI